MTTSRADAPEVDLAFLLGHASHVLATELTARLAPLGITQRGYCVLSNALPGDRTQIKLAEQCGMDKTTMVVTIDELEAAGLVERQLSPTDRRARIIAPTTRGRQTLTKAKKIVQAVYTDVLAVLPTHEREALLPALTRLVETRLTTPVHSPRTPRRRR